MRAETLVALFIMLGLLLRRDAQDMPRFRWENFTTANGLPNNHVSACWSTVTASGPALKTVLGSYENGTWKVFRPS